MGTKNDNIWAIRATMSRPNYAVLSLLTVKSPRSLREIYKALEDQFTRKTLIIAIRDLSHELNLIEPSNLRYKKDYVIAYGITPEIAKMVRAIRHLERVAEEIKNNNN